MEMTIKKVKNALSLRKKTNSSVRSLIYMILITIVMLLGSLVFSSIYLNRLSRRALSNYDESLSSALSFWNVRFEVINASLLQIADPENEAYFYVASFPDTFNGAINKPKLQKQLDYYARSQQYDFHFFSFFPGQSLFIESRNYIKDYNERHTVNDKIQSFIREKSQDTAWSLITAEGHSYLLTCFYIHDNYIGAFIDLDNLVDQLKDMYSVPVRIQLLNKEGSPVYSSSEITENNGRVLIYDHKLSNLNYNVRIIAPGTLLYKDQFSLLSAGTLLILIGVCLLFYNIRYHIRHVLTPLEKLKSGMQAFSSGNTDIRLDVNPAANDPEISSLYTVFNNMVEQITSLKIKVYEQELENRRIESDYILTRIQPHFYANILNLILFLAQVKDYENIQKLSYAAGTYFRFLLGEKGTFVRLSDELKCVNAYVDVQHIRYKELFEFEYNSGVDEDQCVVLPMLIQTFIGNSIKHNVTFVPLLHISVSTSVSGGVLTILIRDDGIGFDPETLAKIQNNEPIEDNGHHIGIQNIKARMKMFLGGQGNIDIKSQPGETLVTITLPFLSKEAIQT